MNAALNDGHVNGSVRNSVSGANVTIGRSGFEIELSDRGWQSGR